MCRVAEKRIAGLTDSLSGWFGAAYGTTEVVPFHGRARAGTQGPLHSACFSLQELQAPVGMTILGRGYCNGFDSCAAGAEERL